MPDNLMDDINTYLQAGKNALSIIKDVIPLLPKGTDRDKAASDVEKAEQAIKASNAAVARSLGFTLCKCTFPPQIMLWKEDQQANVCPNCGHSSGGPPKINRGPRGGTLGQSRGGRGSWMG